MIAYFIDPTQYIIRQDVIQDDDSQTIYSALYKFRYPAGVEPHSSALFSDISAENVHQSQASLVYDGVRATEAFLGQPVGGILDYTKSGNYYTLEQYDGGWDMGPYTPPSDGTATEQDYRSPCQGFDENDRSRSNSVSPTSACFPSDLSNYVSLV